MNIFVLDRDPTLAAKAHCDKHASKMVLETAQILSTVNHLHGRSAPYKPTHINHPCVRWAAECQNNYQWLWSLGLALGVEFRFRRGKDHKSLAVIRDLAAAPMTQIKKGGITFVQCLPDELKCGNPVVAYRRYYIQEKRDIATWDWGRDPPSWWPGRGVEAMKEAVEHDRDRGRVD